jgi:polar amino acid transport system substrate-binding protein
MKALDTIGAAALAAGLTLGLSGPAAAGDTQQALSSESVLETIKKRGELRVGLSTFVPWAMRDKNGELIGFEIDVAKKVAEDMGVTVDFVPTAWDGIIPALLAGKFDAIISGMSITPKRNLTVNFTRPYANTGYILMANSARADEKGLMTLEDFNQSSVTIASRRATTGAVAMQKNFPKAKLVYFDDDNLSYQEAANGNVDGVSSTPPKAAFEIEKRGDVLRVVSPKLMSPTREAFAVRKGDPDILNFFNNWIQEKHASGWLKERHDYWFTTRDWADMVAPAE